MQATEIFDYLSEVPLLRKLIDFERLFFVGDRETIQYLQNFFEQRKKTNQHHYYFWQEELQSFNVDRDRPLDYQAIIVASIENEHVIYRWLIQQIEKDKSDLLVLKLFSDLFVNTLSESKILKRSHDNLTSPKIAYAIVSTARSGSTALCKALTDTKIAGFPQEHIRQPTQILTQNANFNWVECLKVLMSNLTTKNGVFGTKFISHYFKQHYEKYPYDFDEIIARFKFIYLIRRDKIAQAASALVAQKTQTWHIDTGSKYKDYKTSLDKLKVESSDLEDLHKRYQLLLQQEAFWERFFEEHSVSPLKIEYEQFAKTPEKEINQILQYLEIIDRDRIKILNRYQYKLYSLTKNLNLFGDDQKIIIKLKSKKLPSSFSQKLIQSYKEKYSQL
jgi:trehalose 2-sulfotransferase